MERSGIKTRDMVLIGGTWYHVEEIDADGTIWASDEDGGEREVDPDMVDAYEPYHHIIDYS